MRVGSLFAGIGGFDLAARWMGWETAWFSEIDPYASAVLAKHWPGVPNHGDITKIDFRAVEPVDLLCGGFPCQDLSQANQRGKGLAGERSGLWAEYARAVRELRPRWVVIENVPTLLSRGFAVVRGDLRAAGYRVARPVIMSASAVGAPHIRERLWIVAHADSVGLRGGRHRQDAGAPGSVSGEARQRQRLRPHTKPGGQALGYATGHERLQERDGAADQRDGLRSATGRMEPRDRDAWGTATAQRGEDGTVRLVEPGVFPLADGIPGRLGQIRAYGNAIVPQAAFAIFRALDAQEEAMRAVA